MTTPQLPPFTCSTDLKVASLLFDLKISIGISTYQAGKIILLSANEQGQLIQLPRNFKKPMGIAIHEKKEKIAIATSNQILVFKNVPQLNNGYKGEIPTHYDAMYVPRTQHITGPADIHDLSFLHHDLVAVNTLFSCIVKLTSDFNFEPIWMPNFIDRLEPEDRCHLNGMATEKNEIKYVSAFNNGNTAQSWRKNIKESGIIIKYDTKEIVHTGLAMPHSPRIHDHSLYFLQSAKGSVCVSNPKNGTYEEMYKSKSFVRGMSFYKDYVFIGLSKLRESSSTFAHLAKEGFANHAGILILNCKTGEYIGTIEYLNSVEEIFDVCILEHTIKPNILNLEKEESYMAMETPFGAWWAVGK